MIDIDYAHELKARIKVIGVGGGGNNAVARMVEEGIESIDFLSANTDSKALNKSKAAIRIQLGEKLTRGLGAGGKPEMGRRAAEESRDMISNAIENTDLLFITAGMGGGTGTGAAPVIAQIAREKGILTIGVVTKPFVFEGGPRMRNAIAGIAELKKNVDTLVIIPNERLLSLVGDDVSLVDAFKRADEVLRQGVIGISGVILDEGLVNLDFADVQTVMRDQGIAHMGIGRASGKNKIETAIREAINSPLLETSIHGAKGVIISFTGDSSIGLKSVSHAAQYVVDELDSEAEVMFGATIDDTLKDEVMVTVIATGLEETPHELLTKRKKPEEKVEQAVEFPTEVRGAPKPVRQIDHYSDEGPADTQTDGYEREEVRPIRESNFRLIHEDVATPQFLRDWKSRKEQR